MTRFRSLALALVAVVCAAPALAQPGPGRWVRVEVNPYVGVLVFDDSDLEDLGLESDIGPLAGARIGVALGDDWLLEGSYGWAGVTLEPSEFVDFPDPVAETDLDVHLLHGSVGYRIGSEVAATQLVLSAGVGAVWVDPEGGDGGDADAMVTVGAGFTHPVNDRIAFKGDFRDHVTFCSAPERAGEFSGCVADETLHHFELSGGLQFFLF